MDKLSKNKFEYFSKVGLPIRILLLIPYCIHGPDTIDSLLGDSPGHTCTTAPRTLDTSPLGAPRSQHSSPLGTRRCSGGTISHRSHRNCQSDHRLSLPTWLSWCLSRAEYRPSCGIYAHPLWCSNACLHWTPGQNCRQSQTLPARLTTFDIVIFTTSWIL